MEIKKLLLPVLLLLALAAGAQSLDLAAGISSVGGNFIGGGVWPGAGMTAMFFGNRAGVQADFSIRAAERLDSFNNTFRPNLMSFSLALRPAMLGWTPELDLGYALERVEPGYGCIALPAGPPCAKPPNVSQGGFHFGVDVQHYFSRHGFIRFEYHQYIFRGIDHPARFAASLGYTFGHRH